MSPNTKALFETQARLKSELGLQKVVAVRNKNYKINGTKSYVAAMRKYGFQPTKPGPYVTARRVQQRGHVRHSTETEAPTAGGHPVGGRAFFVNYVAKKADDGTTGEVPAEDAQTDTMYVSEVQIGTPPQTLKLDFDTGSADLWIFSTELSKHLQKGHTVYDPSKSSTYKEAEGLAWKIQYGDGSSASGSVGTDVVTIGGLAIQNQAIELAKSVSTQFAQDNASDGLLGLAWPQINTVTNGSEADPQPTPVANLISSKTLPQDAQLFTSAFYSSRDNAESFYTFGYIDEDLVKSSGTDIAWTDIDKSEGFWMFQSESATINGTKIAQGGNTAIADTGTTLLLVADKVVEALYGSISGSKYDTTQQGYLIPKSVTLDELPTFSVAVGNKEFVVQKEDLVFAEASDDYWFGGVQSRGTNGFDILGDVFLKSVYAIWDQGNTRFGLVPKIEAKQNLGDGN